MKKTITQLDSNGTVLAGFTLLGLETKQNEVYSGAVSFATQFKRCSILKDTPTFYSNSTNKN